MKPIRKMKYHNPLDVLVLPKEAEHGPHPAPQNAENALGLDTSKPVACCHILQAVQLQELMEQELFPDCDIEIVPGNLAEALNRLDGEETADDKIGSGGAGNPDNERTQNDESDLDSAGATDGESDLDSAEITGGESRYSGLICNGFDLEQLGQDHRVRAIFPVEEMIPTGGRDCKNEVEKRAEAAFSAEMQRLCVGDNGSQSSACTGSASFLTAVYAEGDEEEVELWAVCCDPSTGEWWTDWIAGKAAEAESMAVEFATQMTRVGLWADEDETT